MSVYYGEPVYDFKQGLVDLLKKHLGEMLTANGLQTLTRSYNHRYNHRNTLGYEVAFTNGVTVKFTQENLMEMQAAQDRAVVESLNAIDKILEEADAAE